MRLHCYTTQLQLEYLDSHVTQALFLGLLEYIVVLLANNYQLVVLAVSCNSRAVNKMFRLAQRRISTSFRRTL